MQAITIDSRLQRLEFMNIDEPELGGSQVRVAVRAASLNRADLAVLAGTHGGGAVGIAGLDAAGEIIDIGDDVDEFKVGDRVMMMISGGLAERVVVDTSMAIRIPDEWSYVEGAAAVLGLMTAHNALVTAGRMSRGDSVLIHAATSAVGVQSVQLARHFGAGWVVGTARSLREIDALRALGMDELIVAAAPGWAKRARELTDDRGFDIVLDFAGGPYLAKNIEATAIKGRIIGIGRLAGADGHLDMEKLAYKRLEIIGVTFRTRDGDEKQAIAAGVRQLLNEPGADPTSRAAHALRPVVERTMSWTKAGEAYQHLQETRGLGKVVLEVNGRNHV
ncbi:zinc-binding dehydrogenase [Nocardia nova]|uniref:zinc-binding dehydrogenase n=1 Tax=Nocardia nova TaxID=37330 RepID=UPI003710A47C